MTQVFRRNDDPDLPVAVRSVGCWIEDAEGNRYLDGASGAVAVNIGHGDRDVAATAAEQLRRLTYVHATEFTSDVLEAYSAALAPLVPIDDARVFPVSGGSEAVETALKLARSFHLARGEDRDVIIARSSSYHGSTRGALDASDRPALQDPFASWLGLTVRVPAVMELRCPSPGHPVGCGQWHADLLDQAIRTVGSRKVAGFLAEPIGGATSAGAVPPDDYWPAIREVCDRHGVLLIADEVMSGFGRTGKWFGLDHWGVRADILVAAKGASSGYWPIGLCVASGDVADQVSGRFMHGLTWSHHPVGAAICHSVLRRIQEQDLVDSARSTGDSLNTRLRAAFLDHPAIGEVRGKGLLLGVEFVADRDTLDPFDPTQRVAMSVSAAAKRRGLLVYPSSGFVGGSAGDAILVAPPLIIIEEECVLLVRRLVAAVDEVLGPD